jgi:hypothetical protein
VAILTTIIDTKHHSHDNRVQCWGLASALDFVFGGFMRIVFGKSVLAIISMGFLPSCSSTPRGPEFAPTEVLERAGGLSKTPEWATGLKSAFDEEGKAVFVSTLSMSGDARVEACMRGAETVGREKIVRYIQEGITSSGQVNELSATQDPGVEALTAFLAQGKLSGVKVLESYWEKRVQSSATGTRELRIHCAAKVGIDKGVLEKQLRDALSGGQAGNPEVRQKLLNAQKDFIDNFGKEAK